MELQYLISMTWLFPAASCAEIRRTISATKLQILHAEFYILYITMAFYSSGFENTAAITLSPAWNKKAEQQQHTMLDLPIETKNKVRFIIRVYEKVKGF